MANQWYLRTQDDTFGPETRERLLEWARMGRIQPGQEVSEDGETWIPATEVPFLDMRWSIDIGDGNPRGPFNRQAAQALLASGRLPKCSRLVEVKAEPVEEVVVPETPVAEPCVSSPEPTAAPVVAETSRAEDLALIEDLRRQLATLQAGLKAAEHRAAEAEQRAVTARSEAKAALKAADIAEARMVAVQSEAEAARAETGKASESLAALQAETERLQQAREGAENVLAQREAELASLKEEKDAELAAKEKAQEQLAQTAAELKAAEAKVVEAESDLADLVSASQENEAAYEDKIQSLSEEIRRLPPTAQLAADVQTALYTLMKEEADELGAALEEEQKELELLRQWRQKRSERLLARRQEILRHIGTDAQDMTKRALKAHPEDPRTVHLRQELDALRVLQERSALESEQRIRDLTARLRERETEATRLRQQAADVTVVYRQLQETRERLKVRERELMEERQRAEAAHQQHAAAQQALMTRLSSLEKGLPGGTNQSREARGVKLAPWMGLRQ